MYEFIGDFHVHSAYARACSPQLTVEQIRKTAIIKGIDIIGTGDCTHPTRFAQLQEQCDESHGLLTPIPQLREQWINDILPHVHLSVQKKIQNGGYPRYILSTEINSIFVRYNDNKQKKYRIHNCLLVPGFNAAHRINAHLGKYGKIDSDGRLGVHQDQCETLARLKQHVPNIIFFPAHIWTPYFGVLGSRSFTSLHNAYRDSYHLIDSIETGLSSDPWMQWVHPSLDPFCIVSNSDAHSLPNLAREGNILTSSTPIESLTYTDIEYALKYRKYNFFKQTNNCHPLEKEHLDNLYHTQRNTHLTRTIEFYPQEGKYFGDGCAADAYPTTPEQTIAHNGRSPLSGKKITIGVLHRTYSLADTARIKATKFGEQSQRHAHCANTYADTFHRPQYDFIVPMWDIIKDVWGANKGTKTAQRHYNELIQTFGSEFFILRSLAIERAHEYHTLFGEALRRIRSGEITIRPGYDGIFGAVSIFSDTSA